MYLDNVMNRNWQKILYGFVGLIAILLMISGILLWIADDKANEVNDFISNAGLVGKVQTVTAGCILPVLIGVFWTFYSNKLQVKKQSNNLQFTVIALIIVAVCSAAFLAYQKYDLYNNWYNFLKQTKSVQIQNNSWNIAQWDIMTYRHIGMIINVAASALSIIPITIYIRRSNSFWR